MKAVVYWTPLSVILCPFTNRTSVGEAGPVGFYQLAQVMDRVNKARSNSGFVAVAADNAPWPGCAEKSFW